MNYSVQETQAGEGRLLSKYLKPDLLIIDDMGLKVLPQKSGEILLEIIIRRYENRSTMMTSNRPIEEWGKLLNDVPAASAILDRLLHHAEIIPVNGRSYRLQPNPNTPHPRALRILQFQSKSGINGASLRAARHLFRFGLDLEHAPRRAGHCNLRFDQCSLVPRSHKSTANYNLTKRYLPTSLNPSIYSK